MSETYNPTPSKMAQELRRKGKLIGEIAGTYAGNTEHQGLTAGGEHELPAGDTSPSVSRNANWLSEQIEQKQSEGEK
jgi:hypothetical protein